MYRNRGDGHFDTLDPIPVSDSPTGLAIADLTDDGIPDLAVTNYEAVNVTVLAGRGDATFAAPIGYGVRYGPSAIAAGEIDGNPGPDLVVAPGMDLLLSAPREPVVVDIAGFTATASPAGVAVRWKAANESGVLGYHVHRATSGADGQRLQVTPDLVLAGAQHYAVTDTDAVPGRHDYWLEEISRRGGSSWIGPRSVVVPPAAMALRAWAEPVPFAAETVFVIARRAPGAVHLRVYDLEGRVVRQLLDPGTTPGETIRLPWAGTDQSGHQLPAGVYFYRVANGSETVTGKVTIAR